MTDMPHLGTASHHTRTVANSGAAPGPAGTIGECAAGTSSRSNRKMKASGDRACEVLLTPFRRGVKWPDAHVPLIHANRSATLGEMSASIHEVNHSLAIIAANATASLRWLTRANPGVGEAILAIREVLRDVERASGMIQQTALSPGTTN